MPMYFDCNVWLVCTVSPSTFVSLQRIEETMKNEMDRMKKKKKKKRSYSVRLFLRGMNYDSFDVVESVTVPIFSTK